MTIEISIIGAINEVSADEWNTLVDDDNPFARFEFLDALEQYDCVGQTYGWLPQHIIVKENNKLIGASPMYLKNNSYGEFVFDWAWADAYHRSGLEYYPKLVTSIPYTPATGQRFLISVQERYKEISNIIINAAIQHAKRLGVSSMHWLFPDERDTEQLQQQKIILRPGCQFHWEIKNYNDFLLKESHQVHTKTGQVTARLWIYDIVVNTTFIIPYFNFSCFDEVRSCICLCC